MPGTFLCWRVHDTKDSLSDTGRRRTAGTAVRGCSALVGGYAPFGFDDADYCVAGGTCSLACCHDMQVVEERKQAVRRMKGGGGFERGTMLSQCEKGRGQGIS